MASTATKFLLNLFVSVLLLFILYRFAPLSHHNNPSPTFPVFNDLLEAFSIFKFNEKDLRPSDEDTDIYLPPANPGSIFNHLDNITWPSRPWPLLYDEDVAALTEKNFSDFMAKNKYVMVLFYAPWCYWSKKLAPEYVAAAKMLKGEAALAMVDCDVETEFARKNEIQGYPTMYFFVNGVGQNLYDYELERTSDVIATWVKRKMAVDVHNITTMDKAIYTLNVESELVLGFLDSLEGPESEELAAVSKLHSDIDFYQTARADVAELFHINPNIKRPALILLQTVSKKFAIFNGQFTRLAIVEFVSKIKHPPVITFTTETAGQIFQNPMKQLWLFAPKYGSENVISAFEGAAVAFREKLLFVHVEMHLEGVENHIAHEFGITGGFPRIIAYTEHDAEKPELNGEMTISSIKSFGEDFLEGKLLSQSVHISEPVLKLPSFGASSQLGFPHVHHKYFRQLHHPPVQLYQDHPPAQLYQDHHKYQLHQDRHKYQLHQGHHSPQVPGLPASPASLATPSGHDGTNKGSSGGLNGGQKAGIAI
ncbi:hypothetical protein Pint_06057 [Pistacia integerrima]|uniref:Uncharacterized protein n=1 Tax=Pistacia integerrima TaxID=434235 RepID=A0ACC0Z4D0_9ROSI|nr:hypothetical protein Pint_06057 [Pistacia integerrima]